jgi:hypothetical protein
VLSIAIIVLQTITIWTSSFTTNKVLVMDKTIQIMAVRLLAVDVKLFAKMSVLLLMGIMVRILA